MRNKLRVLVVDDMASMRRILINLLVDIGFSKERISESDDGKTAQAFLEEHSVDFIVTDWQMPIMSGIDLLRFVRSDDRMKSIPVLMVTAEAKKAQILEAAEAGVNQYIVKPFNAKTLHVKVKKIFGS
jgi:two-component system chemotaxis response regulator CheY